MNAIIFILSLIISLPPVAFAQEKKNVDNLNEKKGLAPDQIQAIRTISRNVLAAKHSQQEDPDLSALRARVKELRQAVKELQAQPLEVDLESIKGSLPEQGQIETLPGQPQVGESPLIKPPDARTLERQKAADQARQAKRQVARQKVRSALSAMHAQRVKTAEMKVAIRRPRDSAFVSNAVTKVEKLEKKLEALLDLSEIEQAEKLQEVLDQMTITKRRTVLPPAANETPTFSTITRHRE